MLSKREMLSSLTAKSNGKTLITLGVFFKRDFNSFTIFSRAQYAKEDKSLNENILGVEWAYDCLKLRVSFERALITYQTLNSNTKPLLLFDEPTAGLDPIASSRIEDLINKTNDKAKGSSIVVSHVLSTIERTSDKVLN